MADEDCLAVTKRGGGQVACGRRPAYALGRRLCALAVVLVAAAGLAGCTLVPGETPMASSVSAQAADNRFELITIDPFVADTATRRTEPSLVSALGRGGGTRSPKLEVGDTVQATIWESLDAGLYTSATGRSTTIDRLVIDSDGAVFIPYAGRVRIAGKTVEEARRIIQTRLERETVRPQVELRIATGRGARAMVAGAVAKPGLYDLGLADGAGTLMETLTAAGGSAQPPYRTEVTVVRGTRRGSINLETLYENPDYDIGLEPGDKVVVADVPATFSMLGAVENKGEYPFTKSDFHLIDALSAAGGLKDKQAQRTGVFLLRFEDPGIVNAIRRHRGEPVLKTRSGVPTVYQLNLMDTRGFFYAKRFAMRSGDVVFVTNAPVHEWSKILGPLSQSIFLARTGLTFGQ
ncbi:polysaccharide biosynthesis/export family protein [Kaustia mangrovi]|uniref:Polysaccharide biosynthesis/export family protein n=1 Tax=Kaustia mangrovi TaxID=2593653 RepID=A0A7S8C1V7_9HYPH|nr:polysaccharide biosynthesis/export family protein [Kaustia mangrovi]QPC41829.1 polysaccharide biosynthesis/export family protein [Kaustia mangrovi]